MAELELVFNSSALSSSKTYLPLDHVNAQLKTRLNTVLPQTHSFPFPISESGITISLVIQEGIFLRTGFSLFPASNS